MRLNERASWPSSSSGGPSSTRTDRSPPRICSAAAISPPIGAVSRVANRTASHTAASSIRKAIAPQITNTISWPCSRRDLDLGVELAGVLDALDVVDDPEVDRRAR